MLTLVYISYFALFLIMSSLIVYVKDVCFSDDIETSQELDLNLDWINELLLELQDSIKTNITKIKREFKLLKNILFNKKVVFIAKLKKYSGYFYLLSFME